MGLITSDKKQSGRCIPKRDGDPPSTLEELVEIEGTGTYILMTCRSYGSNLEWVGDAGSPPRVAQHRQISASHGDIQDNAVFDVQPARRTPSPQQLVPCPECRRRGGGGGGGNKKCGTCERMYGGGRRKSKRRKRRRKRTRRKKTRRKKTRRKKTRRKKTRRRRKRTRRR